MAASMKPGVKLIKSLIRPGSAPFKCLKRRFHRGMICRFHTFTAGTGGEESLVFESGKMARMADGSVVVSHGDTSVLVAVTSKTEQPVNSPGMVPLTVDYRQKSAAAGRIPTNHLRRELGPTEKEILTGRVIDRSLRSKFPTDYPYEVLVTCNLLSVDGVHDPDVVSINAASAALHMSNIPWNGPVGAVRVARADGKFIINPTRKEQQQSDMSCIVTADQSGFILMLEGEAQMVDYSQFYDGIEFGAIHAAMIANVITSSAPKTTKRSWTPVAESVDSDIINDTYLFGSMMIRNVLSDVTYDKYARDSALKKCRFSIVATLTEKYGDENKLVYHDAVTYVIKDLFRKQIYEEKIRCDGRSLTDIRPISSSVDLYKPLHGSALFTRGQTQVMGTVTFDSPQAALRMDPMSVITGAVAEKNFMLHYEFPPYATNEVKPPGLKSRREMGHGSLAERGLRAIIPDSFPFSIRLTSEVLESNGSSSMASICVGTLALMDAGVHVKEPAAGVAIGLVTHRDGGGQQQHTIMTDILGIEDYMGDMDLKIGGTMSGLTAIQMDLKIPGIPMNVVKDAILRAKDGITYVLHRMRETSGLSEPRPSIKSNGPAIEKFTVSPSDRHKFVGHGGINLRKLKSEAGVSVTAINESEYEIFAPNQDAMRDAIEIITELMATKKQPVLEFNAIYESKIVEIRDGGVMIQIHPAMDPVFLPNAQLSHRKIHHPSVLELEVGQKLSVKYFGRDPVSGHHRISHKVLTSVASKTFKHMRDELPS